MKNYLTFVFLVSFSFVMAQEYDSSFADDGVLILDFPILDILEDDQNIYFKGNSEIMSVKLDGSINREFGTDGLINFPLGNLSQNISDFLLYDNKLLLLGSGKESFGADYDIYVNQLDLETGERLKEFKYEHPDTSDQYMRSYFLDSEIHLFGSSIPVSNGISNPDLYNTFEVVYNPEANELSSVNVSTLDTTITDPLIPFGFFQLSDNRLLVDCLTKHLGNPQVKILNDISEIGTLDSAEALPLNSIRFSKDGFIEIEPLSLLSLQVSLEGAELKKMNLADNAVEDIALDFLAEDFRLFSIAKFDDASFLLFGWVAVEDKADKLMVYSVKNNFELNQDFADNGVLEMEPQLNGNTIDVMVSFRTDNYVYLRILTREVRGSSILIRFKNPTSAVVHEQPDEFSVYPSPATDMLYISGYDNRAKTAYTIHNGAGIRVKEGLLSDNSVDIKTLQSGLFYLTIDGGDGRAVTKSFVVK